MEPKAIRSRDFPLPPYPITPLEKGERVFIRKALRPQCPRGCPQLPFLPFLNKFTLITVFCR